MISTNILRKATIGLVATGMMVGSLFAALPVQAEEQSESFVEVHFSGQLIELSSTNPPRLWYEKIHKASSQTTRLM